MSTASALSGYTYRPTRVLAGRYGDVTVVAKLAMVHRKAASVLPEPVGAIINVSWPSAMFSQALACSVVGVSKVLANHSRVIVLESAQRVLGTGSGTD